MTQEYEYMDWIRSKGLTVRLGEIMETKKFGCEYRKFHTFMRGHGWVVDVKLFKKEPGQNLYTFTPPPAWDQNGQGLLI